MAAPSYSTVTVSWQAEGPLVYASFTPHGYYPDRVPYESIHLRWDKLAADPRRALAEVLLVVAADLLESLRLE